MSDECLMKQELGFPFYVVYQAVTRKFTLARKSSLVSTARHACGVASAQHWREVRENAEKPQTFCAFDSFKVQR